MSIEEVWRDGALVDTIEHPDPEPAVVVDPVAVAAQTMRDEIATRLAPSSVNTIVEVKAAVIDGLDAAVERLTS